MKTTLRLHSSGGRSARAEALISAVRTKFPHINASAVDSLPIGNKTAITTESQAPSAAKAAPAPAAASVAAALPAASAWVPPSQRRPSLTRAEFDALAPNDKSAFFREGGRILEPGKAPAAKVAWTPASQRGHQLTRAEFDALSVSDKNAFFRAGGRIVG